MPTTADTRPFLTEHQRLPTSGGRSVLAFQRNGQQYLAVPQFALDVPGHKPGMHSGNADIDSPIYRWEGGRFVEDARLPTTGAECFEYFRIGSAEFLAISSARTGSGPYDENSVSKIYKWDGSEWAQFQAMEGVVSKHWHYFSFDGRHFLALSQGVTNDKIVVRHPRTSMIFEWNGERFVPFQDLEGRWGYSCAYFELAGQRFLAYADHVDGSRIYRWDGSRFAPFQELAEKGGRAFSFFEDDGGAYLVFLNILSDSQLYRWSGERFELAQTLEGTGGRELAQVRTAKGLYVVRVNFIRGTPPTPTVDLNSQLYRFDGGQLTLVQEFPTFGGTGAAAFSAGGQTYVAVSNNMNPELRFRQDSVVYRFND
ncbi:MAG: hypothetical protein HYX47_20290 [Burkholderiales bacterium]|nr:hypothetical protein [Burkholderiales bacterium]